MEANQRSPLQDGLCPETFDDPFGGSSDTPTKVKIYLEEGVCPNCGSTFERITETDQCPNRECVKIREHREFSEDQDPPTQDLGNQGLEKSDPTLIPQSPVTNTHQSKNFAIETYDNYPKESPKAFPAPSFFCSESKYISPLSPSLPISGSLPLSSPNSESTQITLHWDFCVRGFCRESH